MYKIEFDLPLGIESKIKFTINNKEYLGKITSDEGKYYVLCNTPDIQHYKFVDKVFEPLKQIPIEYYRSIFKEDPFPGHWPETSLEDLEKILIQMQKDFEKLNKSSEKKPKLNFSRFRFRIGDTIIFRTKEYKIVGYYFPEGCRICSKIHKTAISVKLLSHTAITGGD